MKRKHSTFYADERLSDYLQEHGFNLLSKTRAAITLTAPNKVATLNLESGVVFLQYYGRVWDCNETISGSKIRRFIRIKLGHGGVRVNQGRRRSVEAPHTISVRVPEETIQNLTEKAQQSKSTVSEVVRNKLSNV